ncbi:MAG: BON domain-containing protein [Burkholderiaceae bacterium]
MAKSDADRAVANATDAARNAGDAAGTKVADAVITTSVNAELVKDKALSALKIDVDTSAGRVALKGTAPSAQARDRATQLASAVKGVVSVDNQLRVDQKM